MAEEPRPKIEIITNYSSGGEQLDSAESIEMLEAGEGMIALRYVDYHTRDRVSIFVRVDQIDMIRVYEPRATWEGK